MRHKDGILTIQNTIFLKDFTINYCENMQEDDLNVYNFIDCIFAGELNIYGGNFQDIFLGNCRFKKRFFLRGVNENRFLRDNIDMGWLTLLNNIFEKEMTIIDSAFNIYTNKNSIIKSKMYMENTNINSNTELYNIELQGNFKLYRTTFDGKSVFRDIVLNNNCKFILSDSIFNNVAELFFSRIDGIIEIYKTEFTDKCYLDYEEISKCKYKCVIQKDNLKATKWTCFYLSEIYKANGKTEQHLDSYYLHKKYERKEKIQEGNFFNRDVIGLFIELTTRYFTSWKSIIISSLMIIIGFCLIYLSVPSLILYDNSNNLYWSLYNKIMTNSIDFEVFNNGINKLGKILYFSTSTFVGKSDGGKGIVSILSVLETLLGVFMTSSFVGVLTIRYSI